MIRIATFIFLPLSLFALSLDFDTFSADFVQTVTNEHKKKINYTGHVTVKKPDKALWSYKKPVKKDVYINGVLVVVYEPELYQAVYMNKKSMPNINEILKKAVPVSENRYKAKSGDKEIFFEMKDGLVSTLNYKDEMDNNIEIKLANQRKNQPIANSAFEFSAPAGIDIIRQ